MVDMSKATILNEGGSVIPARVERIAEIIKDYDDTLELRWIEPQYRTSFDSKPFAVWQCAPNMPEYMVMDLAEDEVDERVIAALFKANNANGNVLDNLEAEEAARKSLRMKEDMEQAAEEAEFTKWAIRSNKTVQHNGRKYT